MPRRTTGPFVVIAAGVLAACGSGDGDSSTATTVPVDAPAATTAAPDEPVTAPTTIVATSDAPDGTEPAVATGAPVETDTSVGTDAPVETAPPDDGCVATVGSATASCTGTEIVIESDGLPDHQTMVGIASGGWNGQWPETQNYAGDNAFRVPVAVTLVDAPALTVMNTAGVTVNGIPFFFPHAPGRAGDANCLDIPADLTPDGECLRDPVAVGEMDECGGHTGRGNDYHYHADPTCLIEQLDDGAIVGFMLDGVPMYADPLPGSVPFDGCAGWVSPDGLLHHAFQDEYPYLTDCMLGSFGEGPRTEGSDVYVGDVDTRTVGAIIGFDDDGDGCHVMTFASGEELRHCH